MPPMTSRTLSNHGSAIWFLLLACAVRAQPPTAPAPPTPALPAAQARVVEGRVVDMRGEGVPLANVWLAPRTAPDQVLVRTIADGEGYFRIGKAPDRDNLQMRATADGYCVAIGMVFDTHTFTVTLQQAATVTGVLRNKAGAPMPDTAVVGLVNGRSMRAAPCVARTDAGGRFVLRSVPLAPMQISAWIPGEGIASIAHHVAADCDVVVRPGDEATTSIAIGVEGLPDDAMTTLRVGILQQRDGDLVRLPPPLDVVHMPQRTLRLEPLPDAQYRITLQVSGWQFTPASVTLRQKGGPHTVKFTAAPLDVRTRGCPIEVRDASGKPVAGVALVMRGARGVGESRGVTDADGKLTMDTQLAVGSKAILRSADDRWVTDQDKRDVRGLIDLRVRGEHEFVLDPGQVEHVRVAAACSVRGRLLQHDGRPAAFTWIELQDQRANRQPEWLRTVLTWTDREGSFVLPRLHAADTAVRVSTRSPLGAWDGEPLDLSQQGTVIRLPDARLAPPAMIEGVLRDADQRPVAGVRVDLYTWVPEAREAPSHLVDGTITDRDGRYRFLGVPPGGARLRLQAEADDRPSGGCEAGQFAVEPGQIYTRDLQLPAK